MTDNQRDLNKKGLENNLVFKEDSADHNYAERRKRNSTHFDQVETGPSSKFDRKIKEPSEIENDDDDKNKNYESIDVDKNSQNIDSFGKIKDRNPQKNNEIKDLDTTEESSIVHKFIGYDMELPPEPTSKCPVDIQERVAKYYKEMNRTGKNVLWDFEKSKICKNPNIQKDLLDFLNIEEKGTNYPSEMFNPNVWGPESYYDKLAEAQNKEHDMEQKKLKPDWQATKKTKWEAKA